MGKRVALIGLDGSGKSANIEKMKRDSDYSDYNFLWVRWKPTPEYSGEAFQYISC